MNIYQIFDKKQINNKMIIGLNTELRAIFLYNAFQEQNNSILVVTNSLYEANQLYQSIMNYTNEVLLFPMDDFLTSEALAISPELKAIRLETLIELSKNNKKIIITNLMGYLRYLPNKKEFEKHIITLKESDDISKDELVEQLFLMGYEREVLVNRTGEIATRGYIVDIFPICEKNPLRIEFWGDTIESIREIDVDSQLTIKERKEVTIYPFTEFLTDQHLNEEKKHRELINYTNVTNIINYLDNPRIFYQNPTELSISYEKLVDDMYQYSLSIQLPSDTKYMFDFHDYSTIEKSYFMTFYEPIDGCTKESSFNVSTLEPFVGSVEKIKERLNSYLSKKNFVVIAVSNRYKANKVLDEIGHNTVIFTNENEIIAGKINLIIHQMNSGFILDNYIVISEKELFNENNKSGHYKTNFKLGTKIRDISKLEKGDYIVHSVYGIGSYEGIKTLTKNGLKKDYIMLQYKGNDKLYLPVEKIDLISKYTANGGKIPKLNKLDGVEWAKTKLRVQKRIENIAADLLKLYAERETSKGFAFLKDGEEQLEFEKQFPYQETLDQLKVTEEIKKDMEKNRPMDRLLCGDVGFGKTEVAFRAAFKAIMSGKQVAMLCPTTILSSQHYQNAIERFQNFGVDIAILNRFTTTKELKKIRQELETGKLEFLIGTHRILSDDIKFHDLGLLIIDEEQRFGVKHKEKIKQYRANIDVLTLSATPIPRTLQMSLAGMRSLSLLETPPVNRYPVQTYVMARNEALLKDAIYKELSRNGQVFILHNYIDDMDAQVALINRLVPEAKIITANGRMTKQELEDVMLKFINHEYDVLICTTIIETGIDIPNANTLIIEDADRFGLAQLYQIRGRVGRSDKIAYCYLMYDPRKILSEIAIKRLNVIKDFTELGSGFSIAMRDLSIRGAGDILGKEQAGFVDSVGIELFLQMLNEEMNKAKGNSKVEENQEESNEPLLEVATSISDDYVKDEELKIYIHKKINEIDSYETLHHTKNELEDRFGKLNEDIIIYMYEEWFEKMMASLNIKDVRQTKNFITITLPKELTEKVNGELLFILASNITRNFRFGMKGQLLSITLDTVRLEKHFIYYLIELLEVLKKAIE